MYRTVTAVFDGCVLHPESVSDLEPDTRYLITFQVLPSVAQDDDVWDVLESLTGILEAPKDWAVEHDYYLSR